jgi:hypothetical protein
LAQCRAVCPLPQCDGGRGVASPSCGQCEMAQRFNMMGVEVNRSAETRVSLRMVLASVSDQPEKIIGFRSRTLFAQGGFTYPSGFFEPALIGKSLGHCKRICR